MDSFALPVQGTETRVNAANEANEYMVEFLERSKNVWSSLNALQHNIPHRNEDLATVNN
jgi:COP9 signalosome complex subunit 5